MKIKQIVNDSEAPKIVKTDIGPQNGQNKCPQCGATDISVNTKTGKLRCNFCRHEFEPEKIHGMETDISKLEGEIMGSGTQDIGENTQNVMTLKCSSCGAEVVIDTSENITARCHWCRNMLSVNQQVPNGAIPDVVLPFKITKEEAKKEIENFVNTRWFFAHPKFRKNLTADNIKGVYFPYMIVDINSHVNFSGRGERTVNTYTEDVVYDNGRESRITYYDFDLYEIKRNFDLTIEGLTVESSWDKLNKKSNKTNNIINSIMPFDIENSVKYNANYLKGYTSEKRDVNIDKLRPLIDIQSKDIVGLSVNEVSKEYDRGIRWKVEEFEVKGKQWKTAYLPVWLYSCQKKAGKKNSTVHYVAVNARTKETMGSVPINWPKLFAVSLGLAMLGFFLEKFVTLVNENMCTAIFLFSAIVLFFSTCSNYRNSKARHYYENETKKKIFNLEKEDKFIKHKEGFQNPKMVGANNTLKKTSYRKSRL